MPDAAALLHNDQPDEAIALLRGEMPSWRTLARIWPSQFRDALANRLIVQSGALQAMNRDEEALRTADEAVAIYQDLAAERPGKYGPDLADALDHQSRLLAADDRLAEALAAMQVAVRLYRNLASAEPARYLPPLAECLTCEAGWLAEIELSGDALAAVHEATDICQDKLPWQQLPSCAARAMLLEGELLCGQARYREAARLAGPGLAHGRRSAPAGRAPGRDARDPGRLPRRSRTTSPPRGTPKPAPNPRTGLPLSPARAGRRERADHRPPPPSDQHPGRQDGPSPLSHPSIMAGDPGEPGILGIRAQRMYSSPASYSVNSPSASTSRPSPSAWNAGKSCSAANRSWCAWDCQMVTTLQAVLVRAGRPGEQAVEVLGRVVLGGDRAEMLDGDALRPWRSERMP